MWPVILGSLIFYFIVFGTLPFWHALAFCLCVCAITLAVLWGCGVITPIGEPFWEKEE